MTQSGQPDPKEIVVQTYENIQVVDDGGQKALQAVLTLGEITDLIKTGGVKIGNPRPDHDVVGTTRQGTLRYRKTASRVKDWPTRCSATRPFSATSPGTSRRALTTSSTRGSAASSCT